MKRDHRNIMNTVLRCLQLRCPACGETSIVKRPFHIREGCSCCGAQFRREEGFFVGAILANVVTTEVVILLAYFISIPIIGDHDQLVLTLLFGLAVVVPLAFYHHSWSFWLGLDHLIESLPKPPSSSHRGAVR